MSDREAQFKVILDSLSDERKAQLFEKLRKLSPEERIRTVDKLILRYQQIKNEAKSSGNSDVSQGRPGNANSQASSTPISDKTEKQRVAKSVQLEKKNTTKAPISDSNRESTNNLLSRNNLIFAISILVFIFLFFVVFKLVMVKYTMDPSEIASTETTSTVVENVDVLTAVEDDIVVETTEPSPTPTPIPTMVPLKDEAPDLSDLVIVIDPGHQATMWAEEENVSTWSSATKKKATPGSVGILTGVKEYELTLDISLMLKDYLEQCGATVVLTRNTNDVMLSNQERAQIAVDSNADLFIRIHADKANDSYESGVKVFVANSGDYAYSVVNWGNSLGQAVADSIGLGFIGTTSSDLYAGLNFANSIPSFQLSVGLLSNSDDEAIITNPDNQVNICDAIARFAIDFK